MARLAIFVLACLISNNGLYAADIETPTIPSTIGIVINTSTNKTATVATPGVPITDNAARRGCPCMQINTTDSSTDIVEVTATESSSEIGTTPLDSTEPTTTEDSTDLTTTDTSTLAGIVDSTTTALQHCSCDTTEPTAVDTTEPTTTEGSSDHTDTPTSIVDCTTTGSSSDITTADIISGNVVDSTSITSINRILSTEGPTNAITNIVVDGTDSTTATNAPSISGNGPESSSSSSAETVTATSQINLVTDASVNTNATVEASEPTLVETLVDPSRVPLADKQCRLKGHQRRCFELPCRMCDDLTCKAQDGSRVSIGPAAEGTRCGFKKVCRWGQCVPIRNDNHGFFSGFSFCDILPVPLHPQLC